MDGTVGQTEPDTERQVLHVLSRGWKLNHQTTEARHGALGLQSQHLEDEGERTRGSRSSSGTE